ncbi:MAG: ParB N-terminal domain-containing protein [Nitrososphaeria archaeon]
MPVAVVEISALKEHEQINEKYCEKLKNKIKKDGVIKKAIAVDNCTNVILDGHHRLNALKELGCRRIPVTYVNYDSPAIQVEPRGNLRVDKNLVISAALTGNKMPPKTSRHVVLSNGRSRHISYIEKIVNIPLSELE